MGYAEMGARKHALSSAEAAKLLDYLARGNSKVSAAMKFNVSRRTVYRIVERAGSEPRTYELKPCGTDAAYHRHIKKKELACQKCLDAHAEATRQRDFERRSRASANAAERISA